MWNMMPPFRYFPSVAALITLAGYSYLGSSTLGCSLASLSVRSPAPMIPQSPNMLLTNDVFTTAPLAYVMLAFVSTVVQYFPGLNIVKCGPNRKNLMPRFWYHCTIFVMIENGGLSTTTSPGW